MLAVAFMLCTTSAWAGLVAEWNGEFTSTQNGYSLSYGELTPSNGKITLNGTDIITVNGLGDSGVSQITVVVGISGVGSSTTGTVIGYNGKSVNAAAPYYYLGSSGVLAAGWCDGSNFTDSWNTGAANRGTFSSTYPTTDSTETHYLTYAYNSVKNTYNYGTFFYLDGNKIYRSSALVGGGTNVKTITIGGNNGRDDGKLSGVSISYIAVYDGQLTEWQCSRYYKVSPPKLLYYYSMDSIDDNNNGVSTTKDAGSGTVDGTYWLDNSGFRNYSYGYDAHSGASHKVSNGELALIDNVNGLGADTTSGFGIMFWVKHLDTNNWHSFFAWRVGSSNIGLERTNISANGYSKAAAYYLGPSNPNNAADLFSNGLPIYQDWQHVAIVFLPDAGGAKLYCNGELIQTVDTLPGDLNGMLSQVGLGNRRNGQAADAAGRNSRPTNVWFDDLAIYKGLVSDDDVKQVYLSSPISDFCAEYARYSNGQTGSDAGNSNLAYNKFMLSADTTYVLDRLSGSDIVSTGKPMLLKSITSHWGGGTCSELASTVYLVIADDSGNALAVSAAPDQAWNANGTSTFAFSNVVLYPRTQYRLYTTTTSSQTLGKAVTGNVTGRFNCRYHSSNINQYCYGATANSKYYMANLDFDVCPVTATSVSFVAPNATDWSDKTLPTVATPVFVGTVAANGLTPAGRLTSYEATHQTLDSRTAVVADVVGVDNTSGAICGVGSYGTQLGTLTKDFYLNFSRGTYKYIVGGSDAQWSNAGTDNTTTKVDGDILININGNTKVDHVYGAGRGGGDSAYHSGDVGIVISGDAQVCGTVVGGWTSAHNKKPYVTGNTSILVKNVQGTTTASANQSIPNNYLIGGGSFETNGGRSKVNGSSLVAVELGNSASGEFKKGIIGGAYGNTAVETTEIGENSAVTVTAPNEVTFSQDIIGGCWANSGTASVGGNSSVTLNGGTYTGGIYAGGYGSGVATVARNATLTLNGGVYSGATISAGTASGTKLLVISDDTDLSSTTIANSGFDSLTIDSTKTLTLGTKRLVGGSDPTLASTSAGVVAFTLTAEEYAAGYANLMKCNVEDMTDKFVIYYNDEDITASVADKVSARLGHLVYMDATTYESTIAAETTSAWSDVVWTKADSSTATMEIASVDDVADATLTVNGTLTISSPVEFAGILTIEGSGTIVFTGNATLTVGKELVVSSSVALDFSGLNLTSMGRDTVISGTLGVEIDSSSITYPNSWTCTSYATATSFVVSGYKTDSDSVSINIIGGDWTGYSGYDGKSITAENTAGYYPVLGSYWTQFAAGYSGAAINASTMAAELIAGGSQATDAGMTVTATANNGYRSNAATGNGNGELTYGYLDDGGSGARITVNNIPYSEYAVLVYMGTDQTRTDRSFRPVTVNNTAYYGSDGITVAGSSNWGSFASARGTVTFVEGANFLKVTGQTSSTLTVQGSAASDNNRCGIAGIQIVNTGTRPSIYAGTINAGSATLAPSEGSTGIAKTSGGSWSNASTSRIVLTNSDQDEVSLTIGESITTKSFRIVGSGRVTLSLAAEKTITIDDGSFDLSGFTGTLCVDSSMNSYVSLFGGVSTGTGGMVRFIGPITFNGSNTALPSGRVGFSTATLTGSLQSNARTIVVEDGDAVTIQNAVSSMTALNFEVNGGSLTFAGTGQFWFGNNSTFTQTGGTVTFESEATSVNSSDCVIFGYSGNGVVSVSGGTFDMSKAALSLWANNSSLSLSGSGVVKAKGIWAHTATGTALSIGGSSKLILTGTQGIADNLGSLTMNGGTIEFQETATISEPLTLTSGVESTINVADTKSATISVVALSTAPTGGDKMLATNGGTILINSVTVGGEAQSFDLCYESDGVYVAAAEYNSVNYYSVAAAIAVAGDANLADITLLNGCTTVPAGYYINDGAVVKCPAAIVYAAGDPDYYNNVQDAVNAANGKTYAGDPYEYVAVYANATVTTAMTLKIKPMNEAVVTVSVLGITSEYAFNDETDKNGIVTYTIDPASTDYTWVTESGVWDTTVVAPWRYDVESTPTQEATRAPSGVDNVAFASAADVTVGANVSVSTMTVSSAITLTKVSADVTVTATPGGIVLTDAGASITVSGVTLLPAPTTNVPHSRVVYDEETKTYSVQVIHGTIFSVY